MTALLLLAIAPVVMWLVQSALLATHGLPIRLRLDAGDAPAIVRTGGRITTQVVLLGILIGYPLLRGQSPVAYYRSLLPREGLGDFALGAAAASLFLCTLFLAWIATDLLRVEVHHSRRKWIRRLALLPATALFGAFVEEFLFRGVVMADVMASPTLSRGGPWFAVGVSTVVFAVAHYVRAVKRHWTVFGHLALGILLSVAFLQTRSLWLPAGLHAGGILLIMGVRPFVRYRGPAWLVGASIFPFAGVAGIVGLCIMTAYVWTHR